MILKKFLCLVIFSKTEVPGISKLVKNFMVNVYENLLFVVFQVVITIFKGLKNSQKLLVISFAAYLC